MSATIIRQTTLQFTDLLGSKTGCTSKGSNKFWKGSVVDHGNGTGDFKCLWGSTGTAGKTTGSKLGIPLSKAISTFESKRKSKIRKGYTELETRSDAEEVAKQKAAGVVAAPVAAPVAGRKFDPRVETLLATIYNETSKTVRAGLSSQAGATASNPIGNLSDSQLDKGGRILDQIEGLLEREFGQESTSNASLTLPLGTGRMPRLDIINLTNDFMSNVPRAIAREQRGRANIHRLVISSYERLTEQRKFLQLLRDAHVSKAIFKQAAAQTSASRKAAVWYDGLNCDIEALDSTHADFKWVKEVFDNQQSKRNSNWWSGGRARCKVVRVFRFTRTGTEAGFEKYAQEVTAKQGATGRIFGWHGTRTANLLGIGKSGLLMPENLPSGVHISGKAFGRGIYHAPAWNATKTAKVGRHATDGTNGALKSMNYTGHRSAYYGGSGTGNVFMFLQEIALGTPEVRHSACWDQKRPNGFPQNDWIYANAGGCSTLTHDEIVTFDENAQIFRYLVEIGVD